MARDSQKQKVYDAEAVLGKGELFETVEECQAYVNRVLARKRLAQRTRHVHGIEVVNRRAGIWATASHPLRGRVINLPSNMRYERILLHEMAHHVSRGHGHDWRFAEAMLALVREMMGREAHDALKAQYRQRKVRFRAPVKRTLSAEQRAALVERAAKAREAKMARQQKGRFALKVVYSGADCYISTVTMKWDRPRLALVRTLGDAQVWATREAAERWAKSIANEGYDVEIIDLP